MNLARGARIGSYDIVLLAQVQSDQPPETPSITVVQNWFAEFRGRHAAGR